MSNVPKLRFKRFSGDWEKNQLLNIGKIITGSTPSTHIVDYYNGDKLFVSPSDMNTNRFINSTKTTLTELGFSKGRKVEKYSVCFVCIGSTIGKIGQLSEDSITNQQINCITANKDNSNDFIYSLLESNAPKIKLLAGVQAVPQINKTDFSKLKFMFPQKQEQEKIATFLNQVDTKIEQLTKKETLLKEYKKGVMQKIFNQEIRFKADDGSEFCGWQDKKLSSLCSIKKGSQLNKDTLTEVGDYPAINGGINPSGYTTNYNTEAHTITISEGGNSCGYVNFITTNFWSGGHNYSLQELKKNIENLYLFQYLKHNEHLIMRLRVGSGLPNIQKGDINNFKVLVPCLEEQNKIANFLSSIDTKVEQTQKQLELGKEFKKALLQQMFV